MTKSSQPEGDSRRRRSPRGILRWLIKFLIRTVLVVLITVVIVCLMAWIGYVNRASIVNDALGAYVEPFDVSLEAIELWPLGEVKISGLTLTPKGSKSDVPLATIPEIHLTYDFQQLRNRQQLEDVLIHQPRVHLTQSHLDALTATPAEQSQTPLDLSQFDLFTGSLRIIEGRVVVDLPHLPHIESDLHLHSDHLSFDPSGLTERPLTVNLENLKVNERGSLGDVSVRTHFSRDLQTIDVIDLELETLTTEITPDWFDSPAISRTNQPSNDSTGFSQSPNPVNLHFRSLSLGDSTISVTGFDGQNGLPAFPDLTFDIGFAGEEFHFEKGLWSSRDPISIALSNISIGRGEAQLLGIGQMELFAESLGSLIHEQTVGNLTIDDVDILVSDATLKPFLVASTSEDTPSPPSSDYRPWIVKNLKLDNGNFLLREAHFNEVLAPEMETRLTATFTDLEWSPGGFSSDSLQFIELEQAKVRAPGSEPDTLPLLSLNRGLLSGKWSEFNFDNTVQSLTLLGPQINLTDASLGNWLEPNLGSGQTGPVNRPVYKIDDLKVSGGKLIADSSFASGKVPKIHSDFSVETKQSPEFPFSYLLKLTDFKLRNHALLYEAEGPPAPDSIGPDGNPIATFTPVSEEEVISIREIEVTANANDIQRNHQVDKVKVNGAVLRVGDGLKSIADTTAKTAEPPAADPVAQPDNASQWTLSEVEVTQSQIVFDTLIPQVEGLQFAIETTLTDVPLSVEGLLAQDQDQKVELAGIEIKDPYNSFITVALLPTIFVEFTLAGLARQEIEKIDLINPSLHVGQGLFWWIDYQRNFRAQNEGASIGMEEGGPLTAEPPTAIPTPDEKPLTQPDWTLKTINATAGKIVIAPTGVPIGMVPFPFNATTNMKDGNIDLTLTIPGEDFVYEFPEYKVNLYGLTGEIQFNVPVQQVDNNLVQIIKLRRAVWKDFEAEDLYLSVTFDSQGIYGSLGGTAYDGYVEGQFNFYLNDPGKWDAWIAGTDFDTGPLTEVIVPDNFLMEGAVSLKLVSEGRDKTLGATTGEVTTTTPGWFDITKFDQILEELPPEWTNLQREFTKLGLVALKRFDYEQGTGSLYLNGREGDLQLRFAGDYGTRKLNLHLHDDRNPGAETASDEAETKDDTPLPEAAARPVASNQ